MNDKKMKEIGILSHNIMIESSRLVSLLSCILDNDPNVKIGCLSSLSYECARKIKGLNERIGFLIEQE